MFERAKSLSHVNGRPAASLSGGLLARKGQAAPAMRPQLGGGFVSPFGADLGWNDMGHDTPAPAPAPIPAPAPTLSPALALREELQERIAEAPAPVAEVPAPFVEEPVSAPALVAESPVPAVDAASLAPVEVTDVPVRGPAPRIVRPAAMPAAVPKPKAHRAAFTLRLDAERHRKLRIAALLGRRSCQQLVTEALDRFLETQPDVADWADRLPRDEQS